MRETPIPALNPATIRAKLAGLPWRRGLWHGPERRATPRNPAQPAWTAAEREERREFGKRPVRPLAGGA